MIDSYTRWLEAIPVMDITADSVCSAFMNNWLARFGPPLTLTTDRGTQFCSELSKRLVDLLGIHHIRTTAYNPRANGLVERSHRSLKAALKCRGPNWLKQLPIVLFGLHMRPDEDGSSAFSRVTGEQPFVPSIVKSNFDLTQLATELHRLNFPYKETRKRKIVEFIPKELKTCTHVWLRTDRVRKPLEAPYQGPYLVNKRTDDTMTLDIRDKPVVVSIVRCKPAVLSSKVPSNRPVAVAEEFPATLAEPKLQSATKSGRNVRFKEDSNYFFY